MIKTAANRSPGNILRALVILPNERTVDLGSLLAVARAEACRREHSAVNPTVRALVFVAEVGVYVAVYQVIDNSESRETQDHLSVNSMLKNSNR